MTSLEDPENLRKIMTSLEDMENLENQEDQKIKEIIKNWPYNVKFIIDYDQLVSIAIEKKNAELFLSLIKTLHSVERRIIYQGIVELFPIKMYKQIVSEIFPSHLCGQYLASIYHKYLRVVSDRKSKISLAEILIIYRYIKKNKRQIQFTESLLMIIKEAKCPLMIKYLYSMIIYVVKDSDIWYGIIGRVFGTNISIIASELFNVYQMENAKMLKYFLLADSNGKKVCKKKLKIACEKIHKEKYPRLRTIIWGLLNRNPILCKCIKQEILIDEYSNYIDPVILGYRTRDNNQPICIISRLVFKSFAPKNLGKLACYYI
jgi:hypothetical protein